SGSEDPRLPRYQDAATSGHCDQCLGVGFRHPTKNPPATSLADLNVGCSSTHNRRLRAISGIWARRDSQFGVWPVFVGLFTQFVARASSPARFAPRVAVTPARLHAEHG